MSKRSNENGSPRSKRVRSDSDQNSSNEVKVSCLAMSVIETRRHKIQNFEDEFKTNRPYFRDNNVCPTASIPELLRKALSEISKNVTLKRIYAWFEANFMYYREKNDSLWKFAIYNELAKKPDEYFTNGVKPKLQQIDQNVAVSVKSKARTKSLSHQSSIKKEETLPEIIYVNKQDDQDSLSCPKRIERTETIKLEAASPMKPNEMSFSVETKEKSSNEDFLNDKELQHILQLFEEEDTFSLRTNSMNSNVSIENDENLPILDIFNERELNEITSMLKLTVDQHSNDSNKISDVPSTRSSNNRVLTQNHVIANRGVEPSLPKPRKSTRSSSNSDENKQSTTETSKCRTRRRNKEYISNLKLYFVKNNQRLRILNSDIEKMNFTLFDIIETKRI